MENQNLKESQQAVSGEIDLLDILVYFKHLFKKYISRPFVFLTKYCLKRWKSIFVLIFIGIFLSVLYWLVYPIYRGYIVYQNNYNSSSEMVDNVNLLTNASPEFFMENLNLDKSVVKGYKGIYAHYIYYSDTTQTSTSIDFKDQVKTYTGKKVKPVITNRFCVEIRLTNKENFTAWADAVTKFLNDNAFMDKDRQRQNALTTMNVSVLTEEIEKLEKLRDIEYSESGDKKYEISSNASFLIEKDKRLLHNEIISLKNQLEDNKIILEQQRKIIDVVTPLRVNSIAKNHFIKTSPFFVMFMLVFGVMALMCYDYRGDIKSFINK